MNDWYRHRGKRWFDCGLALVVLLMCWPVILIAHLLIVVLDDRPTIFRQERIGRDGSSFQILKFRTMRPGAAAQDSVTVSRDPRVTPIGHWLRRCRIDELPQLWNILKGDMSFVGPRPDVPGYADQLQGDDRPILIARPGITGAATLQFANEAELLAKASDPVAYNATVIWPEKVRINRQYVQDLSFSTDMAILWRTILLVVHG